MDRRFYVLAMSIPNSQRNKALTGNGDRNDFFSVIARQVQSLLETTIIIGENALVIQPTDGESANIQFNGKNVPLKEAGSGIQLSDTSGREVMELTYIPQGSYKISSKNTGFEVILSKTSVQIQLDNQHRGKIRGLCGNFDGETYNDFITAQGFIVNTTEAFGSSYALQSESSEGSPALAGQETGYREVIIPGNVVSERDSGVDKRNKAYKKSDMKVQNIKNTKSLENLVNDYKVKIVQEPGKTCFSLRPQLYCGVNAKASRLVEKTIEFHCIGKSNASKHWEKMVELGATPDFTQKGSNHRATLKVPEQCVPN